MNATPCHGCPRTVRTRFYFGEASAYPDFLVFFTLYDVLRSRLQNYGSLLLIEQKLVCVRQVRAAFTLSRFAHVNILYSKSVSVGNRGSGASQPVSNMGSGTAPPASQFPKFGNWPRAFFSSLGFLVSRADTQGVRAGLG